MCKLLKLKPKLQTYLPYLDFGSEPKAFFVFGSIQRKERVGPHGMKPCYYMHSSTLTHTPIADIWLHLRAVDSYLVRSVLYMSANRGTNGSSGFGSVNNEEIESKTYRIKTNVRRTHLHI